MSTYYVGDTIRLLATFRNPSNAMIDPSTVSLIYTVNGSPVTYTYGTSAEIVRLTVGNYSFTTTLNQAGSVIYEWQGTGLDSLNRSGAFNVDATRTSPTKFWSPANDHLIFDNLETLVLTRLDGTTRTILRCLRTPVNKSTGTGSAFTGFGSTTTWSIWFQECPETPEINALLTDAYGKKYRIDTVTRSVVLNMFEIQTTMDAGTGL